MTGADYLKKLFITPDMTPMEREQNKALRSRLREMNQEVNQYRIKNGQIVLREEHTYYLSTTYQPSIESTICNKQAFTSNNSFPCLLTNARSIINKFEEFQLLVSQHNPYIISITESWLESNIHDSEIQLNNFNLFRNDRSGSRGGGVLLYVHKSLMCSPCVKLNAVKFEESLWYLVSLSNKQTLLLGLVYRSPSSVETNNSKLLEALQIISQQYGNTQLLLMGDFNFPDINWVDTHCFSSPISLSAKFLETMQDSFLTQYVQEPTRHQLDQQPSVLDLIITRDPDSIMNLTHLPPLGSSDHECLLWQHFCNSNHKNFIHTKSYNYYKGDYVSLNNYLKEID